MRPRLSDASQRLLRALKAGGLECRQGEPIAPYTTVEIGGPADIMVFPHNADEVGAVLATLAVAPEGYPWLVLGGGANVFADSRGYPGLVLQMGRYDRALRVEGDVFIAAGGLPMEKLAHAAAEKGYAGIDFMAVVPGSVGGAVCINAGTHLEGYVADYLIWVETLNQRGELQRYQPEDLDFGYRHSRLLHSREIVVRAAFRLPACKQLGRVPEALMERFEAILAERAEKFPLDQPNFGSTFRSPGKGLPPAGKLLDDLGMKGTQVGAAQISAKHANFIVNLGGATSEDVIGLMTRMRDVVREAHGIALEPEVHYLRGPKAPTPEIFAPL